MSDTPIIVTATFDAPIETVWAAITEPDRMRQWFFEQIETFTPEQGFETRFDVPVDSRTFRHHWRVTEVIPPRSITYDWSYDGYSGGGEVAWNLDQTTSGTRLLRFAPASAVRELRELLEGRGVQVDLAERYS